MATQFSSLNKGVKSGNKYTPRPQQWHKRKKENIVNNSNKYVVYVGLAFVAFFSQQILPICTNLLWKKHVWLIHT